jgi:hypothetical protein
MFGWLSGGAAAPQVPIYPEIATPKTDAGPLERSPPYMYPFWPPN